MQDEVIASLENELRQEQETYQKLQARRPQRLPPVAQDDDGDDDEKQFDIGEASDDMG